MSTAPRYPCTKHRYPHALAAEQAVAVLQEREKVEGKRPGELTAYQCQRCGGAWHVGHLRINTTAEPLRDSWK
jgi:hypothetical protein